MLRRAVLFLFASLASCANEPSANQPAETSSGAAPLPSAPGSSAAPAPSEPAAQGETKELTLSAQALRVDGEHVLYEPERQVQRSKYVTYRFDKAAFVAKVGSATPSGDVRARVRILSTKTETHTPKDRNAPSPAGGFVYTTHECQVVELVK